MITAYMLSPECWSCRRAKEYMESRDIEYQALYVDRDFRAEELVDRFPSLYCMTCLMGVRLPAFFEDGKLIGGFEDLLRRFP